MKNLTKSAARRRELQSLFAIVSTIGLIAVLLGSALPAQASSVGSTDGPAPGGPGASATWTPANKEGFGTAYSDQSKVWYTLQDGHTAPWTPQERWENQSGYSPATIASEIASLVCAAQIAQANGDAASARRYLTTADLWQGQVENWTVTTNGPYSLKPYFLRLTKDGNPNAGTTYLRR